MAEYIRFMMNEEIKYGKLDGNKVNELASNYFIPCKESEITYEKDSIKMLAPCHPSKIICVGLNYQAEGVVPPLKPLIFMKPSTSILEPNGNIVKWPMVRELTYEGELAVVIGKQAHNISIESSKDYIFGLTIANDVTARDLQAEDGQWTRAKSFDTFLPLGPVVVTDIDWSDLGIKTTLNGHLIQQGRTSQMIFSIPYLISYISRVMTLLPGDVILTGTPGGFGGVMNPGDCVEIEIEGIGKLVNSVV